MGTKVTKLKRPFSLPRDLCGLCVRNLFLNSRTEERQNQSYPSHRLHCVSDLKRILTISLGVFDLIERRSSAGKQTMVNGAHEILAAAVDFCQPRVP